MADINELKLPEPRKEDDTPYESPVNVELQAQIEEQRGVGADLKSGFNMTAAAGIIRRSGQEGRAALETYDEANPEGATVDRALALAGGRLKGLVGKSHNDGSDFNKEEHLDELLKDIPRAYHDDIMDEKTLGAATRARARILEDLERQRQSAMQWDGGGLEMVGSFLDVDAPLVLASGGMIGAAKVAQAARVLSKNKRFVGTVQGFSGGAQAGAIVGAADSIVRETSDETTFINSVIMGTAMGTTFGVAGGEINTSIYNLEKDYASRIDADDPSLNATDETVMGDVPVVAFGDSTVGAAQVGDGANKLVKRNLVDPADRLSDKSKEIIDHAEKSNHESGFNDRKAEQTGWLEKIAASSWNGIVGANFQAKMYSSDSAVMNWMGRTVFESASGLNRGTTTAASLMENYHKRIQTQILPVRKAMHEWAGRNNSGALGTKYGISEEGKAAFNREVMLERNARQHGLSTRSTDPAIIRAADAYDSAARDALGIAKGREGEHSVLGMENVADNPHYTPYKWSASKINALIRGGNVARADIITALAASYRKAGMSEFKDASAVAEAVIRRSELNEAEIDSSVHSLLQADGQEFLRDTLERSGTPKAEVDGIMNRLVGAAAERGKEGFAKSRNDLDMNEIIVTKDGTEIKIVDLLSNDMHGDWQRYTRKISGSAALARQGITSKAGRKEVISAIHAEQRALGEELVPRQELEAMFTHFDGGVTKGWSKLSGGDPSNIGQGASLAKRMVQLAWLNKLGLTQLGETGAMMAQNGLASWMRRGPFAKLNKELHAGNKELLNEVSYLTGEIGQDHHLFADHLNLDELSGTDQADFMSKVNKLTSKASFIQGFTSAFNAVRSSQQKTAALGVMDKVMRTLRDAQKDGAELSEAVKSRMWNDLGLDNEVLTRLDNLISNGTIEFSPEGFVNRLNSDKWDGDLQDIVGSSITRNINQVVQKSMVGEQDAWMHTGWGSIMSHLKTFPLQATHKQFIRHFRHNDPQAYASVMGTFGTALFASVIRSGIDGNIGDMTAEDHGKRAFGYSNMTGFIPMMYDPLATMMGLEDTRFNQYGKHSEVGAPILSYAEDALRLPGALIASATGKADYDDKKAKRTLPFANTMLFGEMIISIGQAK